MHGGGDDDDDGDDYDDCENDDDTAIKVTETLPHMTPFPFPDQDWNPLVLL